MKRQIGKRVCCVKTRPQLSATRQNLKKEKEKEAFPKVAQRPPAPITAGRHWHEWKRKQRKNDTGEAGGKEGNTKEPDSGDYRHFPMAKIRADDFLLQWKEGLGRQVNERAKRKRFPVEHQKTWLKRRD